MLANETGGVSLRTRGRNGSASMPAPWARRSRLVAILLCSVGPLAAGCEDAAEARRAQESKANIDVLARYMKANEEVHTAWTKYATASGDGKKIEALKECLLVVQSLDTTSGSEFDLGIFKRVERWRQARIAQVNAYIAVQGSPNPDWPALKRCDEEVRQAKDSVDSWVRFVMKAAR